MRKSNLAQASLVSNRHTCDTDVIDTTEHMGDNT